MIKLSFQFSINLFGWSKQKKDGLPSGKQNFMQEATILVNSLAAIRSKSTVDNYRTALRSLGTYAGTSLSLKAVNKDLLEGWQRWLVEHGVSQNSISCYMRSLRSLLSKMLPKGQAAQLFATVYTGKERTEKRAISLDDICRLRRLSLKAGTPLALSRDMFLFCFYAQGMPFVDMAYLRKSQLSGDYIVYHRHKTGQRITVKLEEPMRQIIARYARNDSSYVFPILSEVNPEQQAIAYETARSRYNRHLKRLGQLIDCCRPLTSYVARHSWASAAYHANIELAVISKALGHSSPSTTQTYLRSVDDYRLEEANAQLLRKLETPNRLETSRI